MRVDVVTLFPEMVETLLRFGVTGRAVQRGLLTVATWNPRDDARDRHRTVDDRPYGGGPGMVMKVQPLRDTLRRARQAAEKLKTQGIASLSVLEGGVQAWEASGLPLLRGKKTISLERQVRIAAGTLVFIGAVLGYFVNPAWMGLAGFVGAGLVFAGVTDTCGMGMILARMPWNNRNK